MLLDAATGQPLQGRKFTEDEFKPFRTELRDNASGNKVVLELNHCIKAGIDGEECVFVPTMVRVGGLIATPRCKVAMLPLDLLRFQDTAGGCRWRMQPHGGRLRAANDPNLVEDGQPLEKSIYTTRCLQMLPLQDVAADAKLRLIVPKKDVFERPAKIALQAFLKERGFYKGPINGDFGDGGAFGNWQVLWRKDKLNPGWKSTWALQHLVASPEEDPRVPDQQRQDGIACRFGPPSVEALQRWLRDPSNGSQDCPTDGIWGPATARALQNVLATKDITYTKVFCPFADGKFMFQAKVAMQAFLRVQGRAVNGESFKPYYKGAIDGAFGEASVKALKLWLNDQPGVTAVPIDGTIGQRTVRELQRLFNRTSNEFDLNFARNGVGRPDGRPRRNSNPEMQINAALAPLQLRPPMPGLPGPPGPPMPLPAAPPMPPPPARR
mmetsp:Transcript_94250/g.282603  ORF Transcript_94250/g.282603 Transcript_94250/m.282603 type:complete len:438 (-) Transcript_94250:334-1647(-)